MNWITELAKQAKNIVQLSGRVDKNAEQITELSRKLDELTRFANRIANVVKEQKRDLASLKESTEKDIDNHQILSESQRKNLVLRLRNEIISLENRLNDRGLSISDKPQRQINPGDD